MRGKDSDENEFQSEPDASELYEVVKRIRALPRIRPSLSFRTRMALYCARPSLGVRHAERIDARRGKRAAPDGVAWRRADWVSSTARIAAAVALVVVLAFGAFGILTVAARNSNPGDFLYSVKRIREDLELAFTWDASKRAEKNLQLAEARLSELDHLLNSEELDQESVAEIAGDYSSSTKVVKDILKEDGQLENARGIASRLKVLKTAEKNISRRLAAAGPALSQAPAAGARVTIKGTGPEKTSSGAGGTTLVADKMGTVSLDVEGGEAGDLDALVELNGRREILPLYRSAGSDAGAVSAAVSPQLESLPLNQPRLFEVTMRSSDGAAAAGRTVSIADRSGTGLVNGQNGEVALVSDGNGRISFTVTKVSLEGASRIAGKLTDGEAQDLGDLLVLGGYSGTAELRSSGEVTAFAAGPQSGPQSIRLSNGLIRVEVEASPAGTVISSITGIDRRGSAGPLTDPEAVSKGSNTSTSGPRLIFSSGHAAGYEVSFGVPYGDARLVRTYQVSLARGNPYVVVNCALRMEGDIGDTKPVSGTIDVSRLSIPTGSDVVVGGDGFSTEGSSNPRQILFNYGLPTAVVKGADSYTAMACPIDSDVYPDFWMVDESSVFLRLTSSAAAQTPGALKVMLGIVDKDGSKEFETVALDGVGETKMLGAAEPGGFFLLDVKPTLERLSRDGDKIRITVLKRYEAIL